MQSSNALGIDCAEEKARKTILGSAAVFRGRGWDGSTRYPRDSMEFRSLIFSH